MAAARRRVFLGLYAVSGAASLVYEVTWTRLLTLYMGHTVAAASAVLAAFMGGLALGAWLARSAGGRLRTYAVLELVTAASAIALPFALSATQPILARAYADGTAPMQFAIVRLVLSLLLIGGPAAAMGATFPIAARWFAPDAATGAGPLYAANTAGAALGALAAGFWLVPALGVRGTTGIGVALNAAAAAGALWLARIDSTAPHVQHETFEPSARSRRRSPAPVARAPQPILACVAIAVSGFVALVYEVAWTRLLALVLGPTTYAFAIMAASFIAGLATGSAAGSRLARRAAHPAQLLAACLMATAATSLLAGWYAASRLPLVVAAQVAAPAVAFGWLVAAQGAIVALLLLPMTCALGAAFPLALAAAATGPARVGRDVAAVYAANTLGAIAGALAGGFLLLPWFGLEGTFRSTALVAALAGMACWVIGSRMAGASFARAVAGAAAAAVAVVLALAVPRWDRELLASGAYKYAPYLSKSDLDAALRAGRLEFYEDGAAATVSVRELAGTRSLAIDGKVDASNGGDMLTQRLLGLLPTLLHAHPTDVCIIGLGSGVTVGAALATGDVRHVDVVEISPEVVHASALFARENGHALQSPAVRLILGDGRSHLQLAGARYDVIVSEPSNPWMAGVAALFTREFFRAARARLKPDGLLCQWAHTYDISARDLRSIVRTFASVFPEGTMWLVGDGDLLLVGTNGPSIEAHLPLVASRWRLGTAPAALAGVAAAGPAMPFALLSLFAGGPAALQRFGGTAPIQTDNRLALEFSAPRGIYGRSADGNSRAIRNLKPRDRPAIVAAAFASATDESWAVRGDMELKAEAYGTAFDSFQQAVSMNGANVRALRGLSDAAAGVRRQDEEASLLRSIAAAQPSNAAVRIELSRVLAATGAYDEAESVADDAIRAAPEEPEPGEQLASVLADAGDTARLAALARELAARFPDRDEPRFYEASAWFLAGRAAEAAEVAGQLVARHPADARAQNLLGVACATLGRADCARTAFLAALDANPRDPTTYINLGNLQLQSADPSGAAESFAEALTIDPTSEQARDGLAQARGGLAGR
ncbi:MAG: fused MFS/spermidine synthase [Betaproteobacteria bacterium]